MLSMAGDGHSLRPHPISPNSQGPRTDLSGRAAPQHVARSGRPISTAYEPGEYSTWLWACACRFFAVVLGMDPARIEERERERALHYSHEQHPAARSSPVSCSVREGCACCWCSSRCDCPSQVLLGSSNYGASLTGTAMKPRTNMVVDSAPFSGTSRR
jgi:hypothetical protein